MASETFYNKVSKIFYKNILTPSKRAPLRPSKGGLLRPFEYRHLTFSYIGLKKINFKPFPKNIFSRLKGQIQSFPKTLYKIWTAMILKALQVLWGIFEAVWSFLRNSKRNLLTNFIIRPLRSILIKPFKVFFEKLCDFYCVETLWGHL